MDRGTCSSCKAAIIWVDTERGNVMPLDAEPVPNGNVVIVGGKACVVPHTRGLFGPLTEGPRYRPHWVSCPNRDQHRKRKGR